MCYNVVLTATDVPLELLVITTIEMDPLEILSSGTDEWVCCAVVSITHGSKSNIMLLVLSQHVFLQITNTMLFTLSVYMMHENVSCAFLSLLSLLHPFFLCITIFLHLSILATVGIGKRSSNISSMTLPSHGHLISDPPETLNCMPINSTDKHASLLLTLQL